MRPAGFLLLLIVGLAALVGPAQARSQRVVMNGAFQFKPHEFPVGGDGDFLAHGVRWQSRGPAASAHNCSTHGMPIAVRSITARDCARARSVVPAWFRRLKAPGGNRCLVPDGSSRPATCTVGSWRCTTVHTVNGQTYPVTCTADRGRRRVHFVNEV